MIHIEPRHTDIRHRAFQKQVLDILAEEFEDTNLSYLSPVVLDFFKGKEIKSFWEERVGCHYLMFTEEPANPHLIIGFGDVSLQEWNGFIQWGVYANEGHELGIWGETQLTSPYLTVTNIFRQIEEILERGENA